MVKITGRFFKMTQEELKKLQGPLKETYRADPDSARLTLRAVGAIGEGITCKVESGKAIVEAGLHKYTGGTGILVCSGDLLLEALVACAGVTLRAVSTATEIEVKGGKITAEGDLDFRGTLGVSKDVPVGFTSIRLLFSIDTEATDDQISTLAKLTERYCVVYQTLSKGVDMKVNFQRPG